jgi:hypothetical protein
LRRKPADKTKIIGKTCLTLVINGRWLMVCLRRVTLR